MKKTQLLLTALFFVATLLSQPPDQKMISLPPATMAPSDAGATQACLYDAISGAKVPKPGVVVRLIWSVQEPLGSGGHLHEAGIIGERRPTPLFSNSIGSYDSQESDITDATGCTKNWTFELPGVGGKFVLTSLPEDPSIWGTTREIDAKLNLTRYPYWLYNGPAEGWRFAQPGRLGNEPSHGVAGDTYFTALTTLRVGLASTDWYGRVVHNPNLIAGEGTPHLIELLKGSLEWGGMVDFEPATHTSGCPLNGHWCVRKYEEHAEGTEVDVSNQLSNNDLTSDAAEFYMFLMADTFRRAPTSCDPGIQIPGTNLTTLVGGPNPGPEPMDYWIYLPYTHLVCEATQILPSVCDLYPSPGCGMGPV